MMLEDTSSEEESGEKRTFLDFLKERPDALNKDESEEEGDSVKGEDPLVERLLKW